MRQRTQSFEGERRAARIGPWGLDWCSAIVERAVGAGFYRFHRWLEHRETCLVFLESQIRSATQVFDLESSRAMARVPPCRNRLRHVAAVVIFVQLAFVTVGLFAVWQGRKELPM